MKPLEQIASPTRRSFKRLSCELIKKRIVSLEDRQSFDISLKELRERISQDLYCNNYIAPYHLTNGTKRRILEDVKVIGDSYTAQMVLKVTDFFEDIEVKTEQ